MGLIQDILPTQQLKIKIIMNLLVNGQNAKNKVIRDLEDFTKTFFEKRVLLEVLTKYCVFDVNNTLLIMRPYQIAATERILWKIRSSFEARKYGKTESRWFYLAYNRFR